MIIYDVSTGKTTNWKKARREFAIKYFRIFSVNVLPEMWKKEKHKNKLIFQSFLEGPQCERSEHALALFCCL
jgi:hypothetical protein